MKFMLIAITLLIFIFGCSSETTGTKYSIEGNGTIPALDENQYMIPDKNVTSIIADEGAYIVTCSAGSTCNVQIGDITNTTTTNTSDVNNSDSHDVDSVTVPPVTVIQPAVITPVVNNTTE